MKDSKRALLAFLCAVAMLSVAGCHNDDDVFEPPVDQAVEAGLDSAITTTVVPFATFMGAMGDLLSARAAVGGIGCPDTSGWCSSGTASCTVGGNGLDFGFDACHVVTGDEPLTLDGNVTATPGSPIGLTLTNLFINTSPAISGTGTVGLGTCTYVVNVHTSDATVQGSIVQCDADAYPTGNSLAIGFDDFLVTIVFDGTNIVDATAVRGASSVAVCTLNLDTRTSSCDAL